MGRRSLLALGTGGGAATVAAAYLLRKPSEPAMPVAGIAIPLTGPADPVALHPLDTLIPTDPPRKLPAFTFQDGDGGRHDLAEFAGRPVLLNLWATWCQPCIAELPALAELARAEGGKGIAVVAVATDRGGAPQVRAFLAAHAIDLPVRVDPFAAETLGARGLPTTLIIGRDGRERGRFEGAADWASAAARTRILTLAASS